MKQAEGDTLIPTKITDIMKCAPPTPPALSIVKRSSSDNSLNGHSSNDEIPDILESHAIFNSEKTKSYKSLSKNHCPAICEICGDPATGYHYEVGSCNGCKTFFRRAILGRKKYDCKRGGHCMNLLEQGSRIKCRSCRFDRCVERGMNPLGISTENDPESNPIINEILRKRKQIKVEKIEEDTEEIMPCTSAMLQPIAPKIMVAPRLVEDTMDRILDSLLHLELGYEKLRRSKCCPKQTQKEFASLDHVLRGPSKIGVDFGDLEEQTHPLPIKNQLPVEIHIRDRIPFPPPPNGVKLGDGHKSWSFADMIYAIEYLKTFPFFHMLRVQDKFILAKNVCLLIAQISMAFHSYAQKSDVTINPDGSQPFGGLLPPSRVEYDKHKRVIAMLISLKMDKNEYVLLKALVTCNPALDDLSEEGKRVITTERDKYAKCLLSYVLAHRGIIKGPQTYAAIISISDVLSHVAKRHKDVYVAIQVLGLVRNRDHNQLMSDIYDI